MSAFWWDQAEPYGSTCLSIFVLASTNCSHRDVVSSWLIKSCPVFLKKCLTQFSAPIDLEYCVWQNLNNTLAIALAMVLGGRPCRSNPWICARSCCSTHPVSGSTSSSCNAVGKLSLMSPSLELFTFLILPHCKAFRPYFSFGENK